MNYISVIKLAIKLFPYISLIILIPYIIINYKNLNFIKLLILYSFILYFIIIYFLVILPLPSINEVVYNPHMINIKPFNFINDMLKEQSFKSIYTVVFNILMTIPLGMYLKYYLNSNLKKVIILVFIISMFFELTQATGLYYIYKYPYRVFDVDDLIMNTLGGLIGFYIMYYLEILLSKKLKG